MGTHGIPWHVRTGSHWIPVVSHGILLRDAVRDFHWYESPTEPRGFSLDNKNIFHIVHCNVVGGRIRHHKHTYSTSTSCHVPGTHVPGALFGTDYCCSTRILWRIVLGALPQKFFSRPSRQHEQFNLSTTPLAKRTQRGLDGTEHGMGFHSNAGGAWGQNKVKVVQVLGCLPSLGTHPTKPCGNPNTAASSEGGWRAGTLTVLENTAKHRPRHLPASPTTHGTHCTIDREHEQDRPAKAAYQTLSNAHHEC